MASLLRKAKHAGKARVKFRFDVTVHSLRALEGPQANPLSVVWTRGPRVATTTFAAVDDGVATWEHQLSMLVTLYRKGSGFQEKKAKFSVKEETKRKV